MCKGGYVFFPVFFQTPQGILFRNLSSQVLAGSEQASKQTRQANKQASKQARKQQPASKRGQQASKQASKEGRKGGQQAGIIQPEINTLNLPEIDLEPSEMLKSILTKL